MSYLIVIPFYNGTKETIEKMYGDSLEYFRTSGYPVIGTAKDSIYENRGWEECGKPDIVFFLNPHSGGFPDEWKLYKLPISKILSIYIPYGFSISNTPDMQFNQILHKLCWRIFAESEKAKEMARKYSDIGDSNVIVSGYPKMDVYFGAPNVEIKNDIWKTPYNPQKVKKIIYSPHHSVTISGNEDKKGVAFSTFDKNYRFILELAKKYENNTSWIFKLHPLLDKGAIEAGVFNEDSEWEDYVNEWNNLPNGKAVLSGTYEDIFKTCDAIINDSISFLAEILYVHKPMLFLKSSGNTFNDFGVELCQVHTTCSGDDFTGIEKFLSDIINGDDNINGVKQNEFFDKYLNHRRVHSPMLASLQTFP